MFDTVPFQEKVTLVGAIKVLSQVFAVGLFSFVGVAMAIVGCIRVWMFLTGA